MPLALRALATVWAPARWPTRSERRGADRHVCPISNEKRVALSRVRVLRFYMIRSIHLGSRCTLCNDGRAALRRCARRLGVCISGARCQRPGEVEQRLRGGRRRLLAQVVAAALQRGRQLRIDRNACCGVVTCEVRSEERDCLAKRKCGQWQWPAVRGAT